MSCAGGMAGGFFATSVSSKQPGGVEVRFLPVLHASDFMLSDRVLFNEQHRKSLAKSFTRRLQLHGLPRETPYY